MPLLAATVARPAMGSASRAKGLRGEHEVAALFRAHGFEVRGLEGAGDHLCMIGPRARSVTPRGDVPGATSILLPLTIHSEVKRQERLQLWEWLRQLEAEAPPGTLPLLSFRRNRSPWYGVAPLVQLVQVLA